MEVVAWLLVALYYLPVVLVWLVWVRAVEWLIVQTHVEIRALRTRRAR